MRRVASFRQDDCGVLADYRVADRFNPVMTLGGGPRHSQSESLHETARPLTHSELVEFCKHATRRIL